MSYNKCTPSDPPESQGSPQTITIVLKTLLLSEA